MRKEEKEEKRSFSTEALHFSLFTLHSLKYGGVAQLGEHLPCKQGVMGSIPIISTKGERGRDTPKLTWAHSSGG